MQEYYKERLNAKRLKKVYDLAPPRVKEYLKAEIDYCLEAISTGDKILELGCGYGRALKKLAKKARELAGIDNSAESLRLGEKYLAGNSNYRLVCGDAACLPFKAEVFDIVLCIQNGISAFAVDKGTLINESLRITKKGGKALFSSYSPKFWESRLEWFRLQAEEGLLGEIDEANTGAGVIICKDGFKASTVSGEEFFMLALETGYPALIEEVDGSSLFCTIFKSD